MAQPRDTLAVLLSAPREAGTDGARQARRVLTEYLSGLGYEVQEQPFRFSAASLNAYPLFGAGLGWLMLIQIPLLTVERAPAWGAIAAWVVGLPALVILVLGMALGWGPLGGDRREDANLIATKGAGQVKRWIVAHVDSKAQGLSKASRWLVIAFSGLVILELTALTLWRTQGSIDVDVVAGAAVFVLAACGIAGRGSLSGESRGARDNGTGLLAALVAAKEAGPDIGVLLTGAHQFGLVGARIFAQTHGPQLLGAEVVDLDTIDDRGPLRTWAYNSSGAWLAKREASRVPLPGVRVKRASRVAFPRESRPFARAGATAVTLSRFDWGTLKRVHTPEDVADGLEFTTAAAVGKAVAAPI